MRMTALSTRYYFLAAFVALCLLVAVDDALFYWRGMEPSAALSGAGRFWALVMLIMWVDADSKEQGHRVYRPYEFGFFVFMFWLPYVPYYFWRTRGATGLAMSAGIVGLLLG